MSIKINIGSIKEGSQKDEIVTDAKELGIDENIIKGKILLILDFFKSANQIEVKVSVKGTFKFSCDRCLEVFEIPIITNFEIVLSLLTSREDLSYDRDIDYIKFYKSNNKSVDLTQDIRDNILLIVPMRKVPDEIDGKCSWCEKTQDYWKKFFKEEEKL